MPDRKILVSTLWMASALALLAVVAAPLRTSGFITVSSRPDGLRRDLAFPPVQPTNRFCAAMDSDAVLQVNALPPETEEQDRVDASDEPRLPFLIPCSFRKLPDRQSIAPLSILSLYPLRC